MSTGPRITRRETLGLAGLAGAAYLASCGGRPDAADNGTAVAEAQTPSCVLVPEVTEGPYFVDLKLRRSDIRANSSGGAARSGIPLELTIKIVEVGTGGRCTPYQARRSTSGTATPAVSTRPSARTPISCVATR